MTYVVTRLCTDCLDMGCVEVCPVDCIYEPIADATTPLPNMLYIHPSECIDCGACEPECPWEAIHESEELPDQFTSDAALNARCASENHLFSVARVQRDADNRMIRKPVPTAEVIAANKKRHGA